MAGGEVDDSDGRSQTGNRRSGYTPDWRMMEQDSDWDDRYGRPFNQFRKAKRHYTADSFSPEDKEKMKEHRERAYDGEHGHDPRDLR